MEQKTAVLLINVGTPDDTSVKSVRRYLRSFLNDPRVIDLPWLLQKILVNLIIVPFRAPKSARLYKRLWTENGSPLIHYTNLLEVKIQKLLPENYQVFAAMRYENPSLKKQLEEIKAGNFSRLLVVPMFPHYASSTTGTAFAAVMKKCKSWEVIPEIKFINQFYAHPGFIDSIAERARQYNYNQYEHIIFSYHGLPNRHLNKIHPTIDCNNCTCNKSMPAHGVFCYRATCYETSRLLAQRLSLASEKYSVSFQSRLSNNWMKPFTDQLITEKAAEGKKKILVFAPAFVADCLETIVEIGIEYDELFRKKGGEELVLVESLNDMESWAKSLTGIIIE